MPSSIQRMDADKACFLTIAGHEAEACKLTAVLAAHSSDQQRYARKRQRFRCQSSQCPVALKGDSPFTVLPDEMEQVVKPVLPRLRGSIMDGRDLHVLLSLPFG